MMATGIPNGQNPSNWLDVTPAALWKLKTGRFVLGRVARQLASSEDNQSQFSSIDSVRQAGLALVGRCNARTVIPLTFCINVFCDLRAQGWRLRSTGFRILALPPMNGLLALDEKARVRAAHIIERDAQLRQPAVRRFVLEMERNRLYKGKWHSIFSLMRDGRDLARRLNAASKFPAGSARKIALRSAIDPYIQVAQPGKRCQLTGLDSFDIWRYFRHTWTTTYQSTPGRKLFFLVRDRAATNHPVIGIAALGSAIVQLSVRDNWIGWTTAQLFDAFRQTRSTVWDQWLTDSIDALIRDIYVTDFIEENRLRPEDLRRPTDRVIARMRAIAATERKTHQLYPARRQHKAVGQHSGFVSWSKQAGTHLFRSKRATALADLLEARLRLRTAEIGQRPSPRGQVALQSDGVRRAVSTVLKYAKAKHVGVEMMDVTVCGAIAPYNQVLGGKLVSLLMASPEVRLEYARRYRATPSVIASSMAGRPVVRPPRLVLLGTTSLYGISASQYNRLKMPAESAGGSPGAMLSYDCLGRTAGYGSYHFSRETVKALDLLLGRMQRGRPVNSIFGEGVNPKLRKVRSALDAVGLPSDSLLQHGSPRLVYGVALAQNFREILMGLQSRPRYILPQAHDTTRRIVDFWAYRWLSRRIENPTVILAVQGHSLEYPVRHGARVSLPELASELGPPLRGWAEAPRAAAHGSTSWRVGDP